MPLVKRNCKLDFPRPAAMIGAGMQGDEMAISIDDDFARFGNKSYAINKINSVEVRERQPHGKAFAVMWGLLGAMLILAGLGELANPDASPTGVFIVGAIFLGLAWWQWERSKIREYLLFLMTSSSETQAFVTRDEDEVLALRSQIEGAMLHHSRGALRQA